MLLRDGFTAPYSAFESYLYDLVAAPAVVALRARVEGALLAGLPPGAALLEVGCGGGQLAAHLATVRPDLRITGLDLSPEQIARARRRTAAVASRVELVVGSALDLPFPASHFDAVLSVASIKHWPDQSRGLAECARVLRPGGALAVVEADRGCRLDDARAFVALMRMPAILRPVTVLFFRTYVAGLGLDLEDARSLAAALPLVAARVERVPGSPGLLIAGTRAP